MDASSSRAESRADTDMMMLVNENLTRASLLKDLMKEVIKKKKKVTLQ